MQLPHPLKLSTLRFPLLLGLFAPLLHASPDEGWHALQEARAREALVFFRAEPATSPRLREARLGEALALLGLQPKTAGQVNEARTICTELASQDLADTWTLQATYQLARIAEFHETSPDHATALRYYSDLVEKHPREQIAQTAFVRLAMLSLYAEQTPEERLRRFASLEARGAALDYRPALRDFHLVMADAGAFFNLSQEASLRHLLGAWDAGIIQAMRRLSVLVRIGELSRSLGLREQALRHYKLYEAEPRGDTRAGIVRARITELSAP